MDLACIERLTIDVKVDRRNSLESNENSCLLFPFLVLASLLKFVFLFCFALIRTYDQLIIWNWHL